MHFAFLSPLVTKYVRPGWSKVAEPFLICSTRLGGDQLIREGFEFDWDSVPRLPFVHAALKGRAEKSACAHDWWYRHGRGPNGRISRRKADRAFLDAMKAEGVPRRYRWPIYAGVRAGGGASWRRHRRADSERGE